MKNLSKQELSLVAIGTALGSNCVPCVVYHIKEAMKLGWSTDQIREAIEMAESVKTLPAKRVRESAYAQLNGKGD